MKINQNLPMHCSVQYKRTVISDEVQNLLSQHDLFFSDQRRELRACDHRALAVGTLVLFIDKTPWLGLEEERVGGGFFHFRILSNLLLALIISHVTKQLTRNQSLSLLCENINW